MFQVDFHLKVSKGGLRLGGGLGLAGGVRVRRGLGLGGLGGG